MTRPWLQFCLAALLCLGSAGCINSRSFWQKRMSKNGENLPVIGGEFQRTGLRPPIVFGEHEMTNAVVGTATNAAIRVSYGPGLDRHALLVSRAVEHAMLEAERIMGQPVPHRPHVYLLRLHEERRVIQFSMPMKEHERTLPWLLPITNSLPANPPPPTESALWEDLRPLASHIFIMAHEACEIYLMKPPELLVMPDIHVHRGFINFHFRYRTRWFRDGLANYVALKSSDAFRRQLIAAGTNPGAMSFIQNSMRPLYELSKARDDVFKWAQSSGDDYYPAATGLFLLLEDQAGPGCIPALVQDLPSVEFPNGKALQRLIRDKTGVDLRELARHFEFPDLGLETTTHSTGQLEIRTIIPAGWAERAGLRPGDLLTALNDQPLTSMIDLELKLLQAAKQKKTIALTYLRNGQAATTTPSPLP